jgi:hypothetical protein
MIGKSKKLRLLLAVLPVVVLLAVPQRAVSYQMYGGTMSCGTWTSTRTQAQGGDLSARYALIAYRSWVLGFLSGVGFAGVNLDPLRGLDTNAVDAWIDQYCQTHPLKDLADAAGAFVVEHPR